MANTTLTNLPTVTSLNGTEPLLGVQSSSSVQITTGQIASLAAGAGGNVPFPVSIGGTGQSTLPQYRLLYGDGTNPIQSIPEPAAANYILVASPGSAPAWQENIPVTAGVNSVAFGTTGLTPTAATEGNVTVAFGSSPTAAGIYSPGANQIALSTASLQRFLINASGQVFVGNSTNLTVSGVNNSGFAVQSTGGAARILVSRLSNDTSSPALFGAKSRSTTFGSFTAVASGDDLFDMRFNGDDGSTLNTYPAQIKAIVTGAVSTGVIPAALTFGTAASGNATERMRIDSSGNVLIGTTTARVFDSSSGSITPSLQNEGTDADGSSASLMRNTATNAGPVLFLGKSRSGALGGVTIVQSGDQMGQIIFEGTDGTGLIEGASIRAEVDGTPGTNDMPGRLVFTTTANGASSPTERMRIDSSGNVAIGSTGTNSAVGLNITKTITGGTNAYAQLNSGIVQSGVTGTGAGFYSAISLAASTTTGTVTHFLTSPAAGGVGSTITNQYGFLAESTLGTQGAATVTNAVGFFGNLASGTNRWNLYMAGTANNYMAGNLGIGNTGSLSANNLAIGANITGATGASGIILQGIVQSDVTSQAIGVNSNIGLGASVTTTTSYQFYASPRVGGAGSTLTNQYGFFAEATLGTQGAATVTNAVGFLGNIAAAANRWNFYMAGTANNYMAGNLGIGSTSLTSTNLAIGANITGGTTAYAQLNSGVIQSGVTSNAGSFVSNMSSAAAAFTTTSAVHFWANPNAGGASSTITNQYGFLADLTLGTAGAATVTNAYGFYGNIASGTNRWNLYMGGTANNYFAGYSFGLGGVQNSTTATATNTATLTATQVASGFIVGTPTATASYTLPTAAALDTELSNSPTGTNFELIVFTTAAFAITLLTATGWTLVGSMATGATANSFARFRARKTGAGAWALYRVS